MKRPASNTPYARLMSYLALRAFALTCLRSVRSGWQYSRARSLQWLKLYHETKAHMRDAWTRYTRSLQSLREAAMLRDCPITLKRNPRHKALIDSSHAPLLTLRKPAAAA